MMLDSAARAQVEHLMRQAAETLILPRFQALGTDDVDTKTGPEDLVTIADREAEAWLTPRLAALLPGSVVVGEEAASADPKVVERLLGRDPVWLVDPVDGTANFVAGSDRFGVMVALVQAQETLAGFIYLPVADEMIVAVRGGGAFLDGARLGPHAGAPFDEASGDYSRKYVVPPLRDDLSAMFEKAGTLRQGHCSAYAYTDLARGEIDFVLQYLMSPWDHAAGTLAVAEAGGAVRYLAGGDAYRPVPCDPAPMLAVSAAARWDQYAEHLS